MAMAVLAPSRQEVVVRRAAAAARNRPELQLGRARVVSMAGRIDPHRHCMTFATGYGAVRVAGVEMMGMRADAGVRAVGGTSQIARRGSASQRVSGALRVSMTGGATGRWRGAGLAIAALETAWREH
jgi:hypothetical protein